MEKTIKPTMEQRVLNVPDDSWKIDRIRCFENQKKEREQLLFTVKKTPLPCIHPEVTRWVDSKCGNCNEGKKQFSRYDDRYMEPIDALLLKDKLFNGWLDKLKSFLYYGKLLPVTMQSLAIHPGHIRMMQNLRKNNPEAPLVFVMTTKAPEVDILLVNYALRVSDIKVDVINVDNLLKQHPFLETVQDESEIKNCLENGGNMLILLDGEEEDNLKRVLNGCGFEGSKRIFFLPVSINAERNVLIHSTPADLGIVKINFHEPYTINDLLKETNGGEEKQRIEKISKHLFYDVTAKRPVMSTNVVAFLLMTEFRGGASVNVLASRLNSLRKENYLYIDLGFDGEAEDIIEHAVEILSELVVVKGDIVSPNTASSIEISRYAEVLFPHFALDSILIVSAQSLKRKENFVNFNDLITTATDLCELLESQIKFAKPCEDLSSRLRLAFDKCAVNGIFHKPVAEALSTNEQRAQRMARCFESENDDSDDDVYETRNSLNEIKINEDKATEIEALRNVTLPIIDCCLTVAFCLKKIKKSLSYNDFINRSVKMMREELEDGNCKFWESCSKDWIKNCLKCFETWGIIKINRAGDESVVTIHPDHNNKKSINFLIQRIERFL